jgi:hypothetical protein
MGQTTEEKSKDQFKEREDKDEMKVSEEIRKDN